MGRGRGLSPQGTSLGARVGWGDPWPGCSSSVLDLHRRSSEESSPHDAGV